MVLGQFFSPLPNDKFGKFRVKAELGVPFQKSSCRKMLCPALSNRVELYVSVLNNHIEVALQVGSKNPNQHYHSYDK